MVVIVVVVVVVVVVEEEVTLQESRAGVRPFKPSIRQSGAAQLEWNAVNGEWTRRSERRHKEKEKKEERRRTEMVCLSLVKEDGRRE